MHWGCNNLDLLSLRQPFVTRRGIQRRLFNLCEEDGEDGDVDDGEENGEEGGAEEEEEEGEDEEHGEEDPSEEHMELVDAEKNVEGEEHG